MNKKDEYATGIEKIVEDHRMICKISKDYRGALNAGLGDKVYAVMLDNINVYCRGHLSYLQQFAKEHGSGAVAHSDIVTCEQFQQALSEFKQRYTENGYDDVNALRLVDTIDDWLAKNVGIFGRSGRLRDENT